ncbi:hypothetical protein K5549_016381, partial [Capra hircus]
RAMAAPPEPQDQAPEEGEGLLIVKVEDSSWEQDPAQPEDRGDPELCRRRFRQFCYGDAGGPHEAFSQDWVCQQCPGSGEEAVALVQDLQKQPVKAWSQDVPSERAEPEAAVQGSQAQGPPWRAGTRSQPPARQDGPACGLRAGATLTHP